MRACVVVFLFALVAVVGCGSSQTANRCPNNPSHCLTNEECSYDAKQGCQSCKCAAPGYDPIGKENPPNGNPAPGEP